jgi:hypothetical protein
MVEWEEDSGGIVIFLQITNLGMKTLTFDFHCTIFVEAVGVGLGFYCLHY